MMDAADWAALWAGKLADVLASQPLPAREAEDKGDEFWADIARRAGVPTPVPAVRYTAVYLGELAELERNEFAVMADDEAWAALAVEDAVDAAVEARCEREDAGAF